MWFKVTKDFGHRRVGEVIELKEDSQHKSLVDAGKLEETEAPQLSVKEPDINSSYSTESISIVSNIIEQPKAKPGPKKKD